MANQWTHIEDNIVRELYPSASKISICSALPNRTWNAIGRRAVILKARRATYYQYVRPTIDQWQATTIETAYIAGLFDGEGNTRLVKNSFNNGFSYVSCVSIDNTYLEALKFVKEKTNLGTIYRYKTPGRKNIYKWLLGRYESTIIFFKHISPYLIIKREEAELVYRFSILRVKQLKEIYTKRTPPHTQEQLEIVRQLGSFGNGHTIA